MMAFALSQSIQNFLFPEVCFICGKVGRPVCEACYSELEPAHQICPGCRIKNPLGRPCQRCLSSHTYLDGLWALYRYDGAAKELVHQYKFEDKTALRDFFVESMVAALKTKQFKNFIICPIPIEPRRRSQRGYNQSKLVARELSTRLNLNFEELLLALPKSVQSEITDHALRRQNVAGKFIVKNNANNLKILLVDDIYTSGATLKEAARQLKKAGASEVFGLVLALAK